MKYNIGDKVKIVSNRTSAMNSSGEMDKWLGKVITIKNIVCKVIYKMYEDNGEWAWTDAMIEHKVEMNSNYNGKIKCATSNREDLFKVGKIYEVKNGIFEDEKGYVINKGHICIGENVISDNRFKSLAEINQYLKESHPSFNFTFKEVSGNPNQSIHIATDGTTTTCVMEDCNGVIKNTQAKCSPHDTFDFETGARIAFDRCCTSLAESSALNQVKEVKRKAKAGEYIKVVEAQLSFGKYSNGDIIKVEAVQTDGIYNKSLSANCNSTGYVDNSEYVVLENYVPPTAEPKEVFKPHLAMADTGEFICEISQLCETTLQFGEKLYYGDVVEYYSMLEKQIIKNGIAVCKNSETPERIIPLYFTNGIGRDNARGIQLRRVRSYKDLKDGEIINGVKVILSEVTDNENK